MSLRSGLPSWNGANPQLHDLARDIARHGVEPVGTALDNLLHERASAFLSGIDAYRHHPFRRDAGEPPVLWQAGSSRLLDYGDAKAAATILLVPSLINRHYIVDLLPERSFARYLATQGVRPLVIDWGEPGNAECDFTTADYVLHRLAPALAVAAGLGHRPVHVCGYCMGGLLSLALATHDTSQIASLILLATPWDFHAERKSAHTLLGSLGNRLPQFTGGPQPLPVSVIQSLFVALDPFLAERKFVRFARLPADSKAARDFVALEDWLNDGVPLAQRVALECARDWYLDNAPGHGTWEVAGRTVEPARMRLPSLVVMPQRDRIVPPLAAEPLAAALPNATVLRPALGHIGMMSSADAPEAIWQPIADWLRCRFDTATRLPT
ncbi:MAG: alpha/beta fold hydrolase [Alphaproteobacteria bacterium]|nr:alpha/beta fold hydrolase [Alphaproteobacteria bacterium]